MTKRHRSASDAGVFRLGLRARRLASLTAFTALGVAVLVTARFVGSASASYQRSAAAQSYTCSGAQVKLFDNSNVQQVSNGGKPPTFSTHGKTYCLVSITTYHWNNGRGQKPGTIGLKVVSGLGGAGHSLGPFKAAGSSGQGGASSVNWTVTIPTGTVVPLNGTYACSDSSPATWSQNPASAGRGFCAVYAVPATTKPTGYKCAGGQVTLLNDTNVFGVLSGGTPPEFTTNQPYCVTQLITYHWNNGLGATPGTIGLAVGSGLGGPVGAVVGPFQATGSAGQGGAANVNWTATVPTSPKPVVIDGTYTCVDSGPATWSQNQQSGGHGFCQVYGVQAVPTYATSGGKTPTPTTKVPASAKCKKGKLSITATPDTGKPPLRVTFALCAPTVAQWRIDFGDGQSKVAGGNLPSSLNHTYTLDGAFRPTLTVRATSASTRASQVSTAVSVHPAQLISLTANPASGNPPLRVSFSLSTAAKSITGWTLDYGDGSRTSGTGNPPPRFGHTYAAAGSYTATLSVKVGANSVLSTFARVTVGGGTPQVLSANATPSSGAHPLHVTFAMAVHIPGRIVSWELQFGDGQAAAGSGKPPASVSHVYSRRGVYAAYLIVSQQQQYGGVQYIYPRGGLIISVS